MNLNIQSITLALLFALITGLLPSCMEDEMPDMEPEETDTSNPTPTLTDGDGALWAIKSISSVASPIGNIDTELGTAVAFFTSDNYNSFNEAGTVSVAETTLEKVENNSYINIPGVANPLGLEFGANYNWEVSGSGDVPAFTTPGLTTFPTVGDITSEAVVSKSTGYTLSAASISNAQEVLYLVGGVSKTVTGNATMATFSASDLSGLEAGPNVVQVAAYSIEERTLGGKKIWVGVETVRTISVEIQ